MRVAMLVSVVTVVSVQAFRQNQRRGAASVATLVPTPEGTVKRVVWGGANRGQSTYGDNVWKRRPEWSKLERCTDDGCTECDGSGRCWYPHGGWFNVMDTEASDPQQYNNYTLVAHAKCNAGETNSAFGVRTYTPVGGTLTIYWDSELIQTVSAGDPNTDFNAKLLPNEPKELRLTWTPTDPKATASWVQVSVWASDVSARFDQCQDREACMEVLATEPFSDAGWQLREENHLLKQCLDGNTGSFTTALSKKCEAWLKCLDGKPGMRQSFEDVLEAANVDGAPHSALLESVDDKGPSRALRKRRGSNKKPFFTPPKITPPKITPPKMPVVKLPNIQGSKAEPKSCFGHTRYTGGVINYVKGVTSAEDCQRLCQEHPDCGIFEYAARYKRCFRREATATVSKKWSSDYAQRWSGPKYCDGQSPPPDFPGCIDPAIADVFSWECDCYENAVAECETNSQFAGMSTSECLNMMTCASDKVCPSWVARSCSSHTALLETSLNSSDSSRQTEDALARHAQSGEQSRGLAMDESLGAKSCL